MLEAFYHAPGGPDWLNNTNWLSDAPLSEWYGVDTNEQGRVAHLDPASQQLERIPVELGNLTALTELRLDSDTGLCLPLEIQDTVFGQLAVVDNNIPLCAAVTALPLAALWLLALALVVLGLRRNGMERQPAV